MKQLRQQGSPAVPYPSIKMCSMQIHISSIIFTFIGNNGNNNVGNLGQLILVIHF